MNLQTALRQGTQLLTDANITAPRLTAEVLLGHAVHCERTWLYSHSDQELREVEWIHYGRYLHERMQGKPTQYITGRQEFFGREFRVTPAVLIPRPETEHLVEEAIRRIPSGARMVDVGCGSGAIAISVALELRSAMLACDISTEALAVARRNALALGAPVQFVCSDLLAPFADRSLDAVLSNPPYIPLGEREGLQREVRDYEPELALFGGAAGWEIYQRLISEAARVLRPGGLLMMELGFRSLDPVRGMTETGWDDIRVSEDLAGIPRVFSATRTAL